MNKFLAALGVSTALAAAAVLSLATQAQAAMSYGGSGVADLQHQATPVEKVQFFWGGYNYCWYPVGWHGPGWYWCGYAWNNGYGWGGGYGWHGWSLPYGRAVGVRVGHADGRIAGIGHGPRRGRPESGARRSLKGHAGFACWGGGSTRTAAASTPFAGSVLAVGRERLGENR